MDAEKSLPVFRFRPERENQLKHRPPFDDRTITGNTIERGEGMCHVRAITSCLALCVFASPVNDTSTSGVLKSSLETFSQSDIQTQFEFLGSPVHPGAVGLLIPLISDPLPVTMTIDLNGFARSNYGAGKILQRERYLRFEAYDGGYVEYRHLGTTTNRVFVLETISNGGGNGIFRETLLVRFGSIRIFQNGELRESRTLELVGHLGHGKPAEVIVSDTRVTVIPKGESPISLELR